MAPLRVLRIYHGGRDPGHRLRERALTAVGVEVTLVVPRTWSEGGAQAELSAEPFPITELEIRRSGDVNRHRYADADAMRRLVNNVDPHVIDIHEEPFSVATRQWLEVAAGQPVVMYTAQNVDKRLPPPFAQWERATYKRLEALYPCSRQAASVARGKGFEGLIEVVPLGYDPELFHPGKQDAADNEIVLGLVGRLVPEKGVTDAVRVLAALRRRRPARLEIIGRGPEEASARALATELGVGDAVSFLPWLPTEGIAEAYRRMHVALLPSKATDRWVEQFGRVIVEAQAAGAVVAGYASGSIQEVGGDTAVLVREGDSAALATAVGDLIEDPASYAARRDAGFAAAAAMTWGEVARRQIALYERVVHGDVPRVQLPRHARARRELARREFGATAALAGGVTRPFALPVLRRDTALSRGLAKALDLVQR